MCKSSYSLKSACKDCPFRKGSDYLSAERIEGIMEVMKSEDGIFPCHKTVQNERTEYEEVLAEILDIASEIEDPEEYKEELEKLKIEYNLDQFEADALKTINKERVCAGWLILSEKEGILYNNFRIRLAAMSGEFKIDEYQNKDAVYDSTEEAMKAHE